MYEKLYSDITDALVNDGYLIIQDALEPDLATKLLLLSQNEKSYKEAGVSNSTNYHVDKKRRSDKTKWIDEDGASQSSYLDFNHGLQEYLNRSLFLGLNYYESHFALYDKGDFYEKHLDAFKNSKNRIVTTVYYLNDEWNEEDGGELILHDNLKNKKLKVIPNANTLVVFMSEKFPHEVLPAKKKRYSIAGWFRVDRATF